jgi:TM2 domain-containing membrane protein YozV
MGDDEKACPLCGETIKKVAIRCKHCHADLKAGEEADFDRGKALVKGDDFEQRFLKFAYESRVPINASSVALALSMPIAKAEEQLEDLAARDVLVRIVDNEGYVFYRLPGQSVFRPDQRPGPLAVRPDGTVQSGASIGPGAAPQATAGLMLNLVLPGVGSIVAGRTVEGILQLVLFMISIPLCFILIGIPLCVATWAWALASGIKGLNAARSE